MSRCVGILVVVWSLASACDGADAKPDGSAGDGAADARSVGTNVVTESGAVRGVADGDLVAFKGIPYAAPPTGALRFAPPESPASWTAMRDASKFGAPCPQGNAGDSEDCLSLNVWAHAGAGSRPVIVWVHGGGYSAGSSSEALYDGASLARRADAVVVSFNYRLGVLGFLALPQLAASDGGTGNWGLRDQIAALAWVQRNIAAFGGDAARVMIAGESAGGAAICTLLASPLAQGLYHAAAMQSGSCRFVQEREQEVGSFPSAYAAGVGVTIQLGCTSGDIAACLRAAPVASVLATNVPSAFDVGVPLDAMLPVVDGVVLDARPLASIRAGRGNVPTIAGSNRDDTSYFVVNAMQVSNTAGAFAAYLEKLPFTPAQRQVLLAMYPPGALTEIGAATALSTDLAFACPALALALVHPSTTKLYELERAVPSGVLLGYGAVHGLDFIYLFGTFASWAISSTADNDALHIWFAEAWGSHARGDGDTAWPATGAGHAYLGIDLARMARTEFRHGRCAELATLGVLIE